MPGIGLQSSVETCLQLFAASPPLKAPSVVVAGNGKRRRARRASHHDAGHKKSSTWKGSVKQYTEASCWLLRRAMLGLRDAANAFDTTTTSCVWV